MSAILGKVLRSFWSQVFLGCFFALVIVAMIEASTTYDEDCGWRWGSGGRSFDSQTLGDVRKVRVGQGRCRLQAILRGDVEMSADDRGVERLDPGATLEIEDRRRGARHRLEVRPGAGGSPRYAWSVDKRGADFDAAAQDWLAGALTELYRTAGLDADRRAGRLLETSGIEGVLQEIQLIPGDYVQSLYFKSLLGRDSLGEDDLVRVVQVAGREVGSDFELARVLSLLPLDRLHSSELRAAFLETVRTLGSSFELRRSLTAVVESGRLGTESTAVLLTAALAIRSDFELAKFLVTIAEQYPPELALPSDYARALRQIGSDFEHKRALLAALEHMLGTDPPAPGLVEELLETASEIGSDHELADVAVFLADRLSADQPVPPAWLELLPSISSDHEQRRALSALIERPYLEDGTIRKVLEISLTIGSDFEQAEVLTRLAERHPISGSLRADFERATAGIGSTFHRERAQSALPPL